MTTCFPFLSDIPNAKWMCFIWDSYSFMLKRKASLVFLIRVDSAHIKGGNVSYFFKHKRLKVLAKCCFYILIAQFPLALLGIE